MEGERRMITQAASKALKIRDWIHWNRVLRRWSGEFEAAVGRIREQDLNELLLPVLERFGEAMQRFDRLLFGKLVFKTTLVVEE